MWFPFWRSRDRFTIQELSYLTDQLQKIQFVNDVNKDFVIEALRSIAELITYGDQHDPSFFEFFMEKQVMAEFVRILKITKTVAVSLQLLQTVSIMIQNLRTDNAIYYMFSNEHINFLITYAFDFRNEELLSYYISFLRAISVKLNKDTICLLVKSQDEDIVSFPLYVEAIRYAFHEENMIRTAVRALTLNVYHVGDEYVNKFVTRDPHSDFFIDLVKFFRKKCIDLNGLVSETLKNPARDVTTSILAAVDEIEDHLYYFSDVISAGIPDVGRLITDNMLQLLILPLLLPSLQIDAVSGLQIGAITSLYLLCCILRIFKIKDLANTVAAAFFYPLEAFAPNSEIKVNGFMTYHESQNPEKDGVPKEDESLKVVVPNLSSASEVHPEEVTIRKDCSGPKWTLRDALLFCVSSGDDRQVLGSLSVLATMLQTKELDETMLDALGILPQRKQHIKHLLQTLVGEGSGEDKLFSFQSGFVRESFSNDLDAYLRKLKDYCGVMWSSLEVGTSPRKHRFQVLDALVSLFCRSNISAEIRWEGGWLLRQLLPYSGAEFSSQHLKLLRDSYKNCTNDLLEEVRGMWPDQLITVLCDEWKKCKKAMEGSSPHKEPQCILLPLQRSSPDEVHPTDSSFIAGERMCELVKVFVLLHQLQIFASGGAVPDQPPIHPPTDNPKSARATTAGVDLSGPTPGTELRIVDAVPCRIAFERGRERHFHFLSTSVGSSGWILLLEELPMKQNFGVVRIVAPLAGSRPRIDNKQSRWLHLRIRPSALPLGKVKTKTLVDGRWTLAFRDEETCNTAFSMVLEETDLLSREIERRLKPIIDLKESVDDLFTHPSEESSSNSSPSTSL